jgi:hypothetical protein
VFRKICLTKFYFLTEQFVINDYTCIYDVLSAKGSLLLVKYYEIILRGTISVSPLWLMNVCGLNPHLSRCVLKRSHQQLYEYVCASAQTYPLFYPTILSDSVFDSKTKVLFSSSTIISRQIFFFELCIKTLMRR